MTVNTPCKSVSGVSRIRMLAVIHASDDTKNSTNLQPENGRLKASTRAPQTPADGTSATVQWIMKTGMVALASTYLVTPPRMSWRMRLWV